MSRSHLKRQSMSRRMVFVCVLLFLAIVLSPGVDLWRDHVIRAWPEWRWLLPWFSGVALLVLAVTLVLLFFAFCAELRTLRHFMRKPTDGEGT